MTHISHNTRRYNWKSHHKNQTSKAKKSDWSDTATSEWNFNCRFTASWLALHRDSQRRWLMHEICQLWTPSECGATNSRKFQQILCFWISIRRRSYFASIRNRFSRTTSRHEVSRLLRIESFFRFTFSLQSCAKIDILESTLICFTSPATRKSWSRGDASDKYFLFCENAIKNRNANILRFLFFNFVNQNSL